MWWNLKIGQWVSFRGPIAFLNFYETDLWTNSGVTAPNQLRERAETCGECANQGEVLHDRS